jgi:Resolvase, N terminal domain
MIDAHTKVQADHRKRNAYLYIRQSTPRQVLEHQESTQRQYGLRQQALRLGWAEEQIVVIDTDLGQSGASAADRVGFQRLVTEVSLGRAGLVLGLEVSRLARNCSDWHRLLEICALTGTLILDEDGLYDPAHFNDRLLLGLKGTMSEAELHSTKPNAESCNYTCRSDLLMMLSAAWFLTRTNRCGRVSNCCLRHFSAPVPRLRWCANSAGKAGCFRDTSAVDRITSR